MEDDVIDGEMLLLERSIVRGACHVLSRDLDSVSIDPFESMFSWQGLDVDSLAVLELVTWLEDELHVDMLDSEEALEADTLQALADLVRSMCDETTIEAFVAAWPGPASLVVRGPAA